MAPSTKINDIYIKTFISGLKDSEEQINYEINRIIKKIPELKNHHELLLRNPLIRKYGPTKYFYCNCGSPLYFALPVCVMCGYNSNNYKEIDSDIYLIRPSLEIHS